MNNSLFNELLTKYLGQDKPIISNEFIEAFLDRIPTQEVIETSFILSSIPRNKWKYYKWGYALYGGFTDARYDIDHLKIYEWMDLYDKVNKMGITIAEKVLTKHETDNLKQEK